MKRLTKTTKPKVNMAGKFNFKQPYIIDSGAFEHIASNFILFNLKESTYGIPVSIPNEGNVPFKGVGSVTLPKEININDVLYITNFQCNLLYVSKITNEFNCFITFFLDSCVYMTYT